MSLLFKKNKINIYLGRSREALWDLRRLHSKKAADEKSTKGIIHS